MAEKKAVKKKAVKKKAVKKKTVKKKAAKKTTKKKVVKKTITKKVTSSKKGNGRSIEYKMDAYVISGTKNGKKVRVPLVFLSQIIGMNVQQRWDNKTPKSGSICKNIVGLTKSNESIYGAETVYHGRLVEITLKGSLDLMGFDGNDDVLMLPPAKGLCESWRLRIAPDYSLLVTEAGVGVDSKLLSYLNYFLIHEFNKTASDEEKMDSINIEAIPVESDPVGFLRNNPHIGSFETEINASEFQNQKYGPIAEMLNGLDPRDEKLVLEVSLKTKKRGGELPVTLTSNLAAFLESIEDNSLNQARARVLDDGKKMRPTKLLGAFQHKKKYIKDDEDIKKKELNKYINKLILDIGDITKVV